MSRIGESATRALSRNETKNISTMTILDAIPSSILMIDRDLRVISANRHFLESAKRTRNNTVGCDLGKVFPPVIVKNMAFESRIQSVFKENRVTRGERMVYRAPGIPLRIYYYRIIPFAQGRQVESVMLFLEDVTEQVRLSEEVRRVERHLASVVESASDIVLSMDVSGRIFTWNRAAEKISGYTSEEVRGRFFSEFCADEHGCEVVRALSGSRSGKKALMNEWDLVTTEGVSIPVSWVCSPMYDDFAQTVGIVAVGRNLAERRKLEMQLLQSQKLAALGVMAGGIAHEIRTPLAVCSSAAQFLMEDGLSPDFQKDCAEKIHVGIKRASVIIEDLLKFARPSKKSHMQQMNIVSTIDEALELVTHQARIQQIEIVKSAGEDSLIISGISGLIQQVFMNLFMNAINAMPDGGTLAVSLERVKNEILVYIADTGQGIAKENLDKIFDPFYTTSPVGKGTGLGLSVCYSIVKQHFGSIEVDSQIGEGTTLCVRLPLLF